LKSAKTEKSPKKDDKFGRRLKTEKSPKKDDKKERRLKSAKAEKSPKEFKSAKAN
jgi:hypothetical protein